MFDFDVVNSAVASVFGSPVVYAPATGTSFALPSGGVFDEAAKTIEFDNGVPLTIAHPILGVKAADFTTPPLQGDKLTVNGSDYFVSDVRNDSHGWIYLILEHTTGDT